MNKQYSSNLLFHSDFGIVENVTELIEEQFKLITCIENDTKPIHTITRHNLAL